MDAGDDGCSIDALSHRRGFAKRGGGSSDAGPPSASAGSAIQVNIPSGAQILSDTMGVDFGPYIKRMMGDMKRNWESLIPDKVKAPELKKGIVCIRFSILPDGKIGTMKLETRSGDVDLDKAAWYAITSEGHFDPLPVEFHGPLLDLRVCFFYNNAPPKPPK
jgi:hypothetical protein